MPLTTPPEKYVNFSMDKETFCRLWFQSLKDNTNWETFLDECWKTFALDQPDALKCVDPEYRTWDVKQKRMFLSKRCYTKATLIRRTLKKEQFASDPSKAPKLPYGAKSNYGSTGRKVFSNDDVATLFLEMLK